MGGSTWLATDTSTRINWRLLGSYARVVRPGGGLVFGWRSVQALPSQVQVSPSKVPAGPGYETPPNMTSCRVLGSSAKPALKRAWGPTWPPAGCQRPSLKNQDDDWPLK